MGHITQMLLVLCIISFGWNLSQHFISSFRVAGMLWAAAPLIFLLFYGENDQSLTWVFWSTDSTVLTGSSTLFLLPGRRSWTTPMMSRNLSQSSSTFRSSWRIKMVNRLLRALSQKTLLVFFGKELLQPFVNHVEYFLLKLYSALFKITLIIMLASDWLMKTTVMLSSSLNI